MQKALLVTFATRNRVKNGSITTVNILLLLSLVVISKLSAMSKMNSLYAASGISVKFALHTNITATKLVSYDSKCSSVTC
jgi:hypothetical protein